MVDAELCAKYATAICYCEDRKCRKIFRDEVLELYGGVGAILKRREFPVLPCGHKMASVVYSAEELRDVMDIHRELRDLKRELLRMGGYEDDEDEDEH